MITHIIEAGNGFNWGKFMLGRFSSEWHRRVKITDEPSTTLPLLRQVGWRREHILVVDLQTGEGVIVRPGGHASADLDKHRIWVCPLFEPFLAWLYKQNLSDITRLPETVELPNTKPAMFGYRRDSAKEALTLIRDFPVPEQDDMIAANMRAIAKRALKS